jgi:ribonuclease Z
LYGVVLRGTTAPMPIRMLPISSGVFFEGEDFSVTAFPVQHRGPDCLGFIFEEKGRRPFLPEKAEALGIPSGPWRRDLVEGRAASLPNGQRIDPAEVLGEFRPGTRLVHIGDVGETDGLVEICRDADTLVIESTYLEEEAEMARHFAHMTAARAAALARQAGVKRLILTHISRRYREKEVLAEAQAIFPNVTVARDFDTFQVKHE